MNRRDSASRKGKALKVVNQLPTPPGTKRAACLFVMTLLTMPVFLMGLSEPFPIFKLAEAVVMLGFAGAVTISSAAFVVWTGWKVATGSSSSWWLAACWWAGFLFGAIRHESIAYIRDVSQGDGRAYTLLFTLADIVYFCVLLLPCCAWFVSLVRRSPRESSLH